MVREFMPRTKRPTVSWRELTRALGPHLVYLGHFHWVSKHESMIFVLEQSRDATVKLRDMIQARLRDPRPTAVKTTRAALQSRLATLTLFLGGSIVDAAGALAAGEVS
jgi:hypothetical protein